MFPRKKSRAGANFFSTVFNVPTRSSGVRSIGVEGMWSSLPQLEVRDQRNIWLPRKNAVGAEPNAYTHAKYRLPRRSPSLRTFPSSMSDCMVLRLATASVESAAEICSLFALGCYLR